MSASEIIGIIIAGAFASIVLACTIVIIIAEWRDGK